jgi:hypothetical protein
MNKEKIPIITYIISSIALFANQLTNVFKNKGIYQEANVVIWIVIIISVISWMIIKIQENENKSRT